MSAASAAGGAALAGRIGGALAAARARWAALATRERVLLGIAVAVLGIALLDQLAVTPALRGIGRLERELPQRRAQLAQVDALADEARRLAAVPASAAGGPLRPEIERTLAALGARAEFASGGDDAAVELRIAALPFPRFLDWLAAVQRDLRVRATLVEVQRVGGPDRVSARVRFERPAADAR